MIKVKTSHLILLGVILLVILCSAFIVTEGHKALVTRLGDLKTGETSQAVVYEPGLHWRTPIIDSVLLFDTRLLNTDVNSSRILTNEQKYVLVDYYVKWRINNLPLYYKRTSGYESHATQLLKQKINDILRAIFGKKQIADVISSERLNVMTTLRDKTNQDANDLGIEVVDVRIKRIELPQEVSQSVYSRMRTDRERIAMRHRASGKAASEKIQAEADATSTIMIANANVKAAVIRAEGQKKAAKAYNDSYSKRPGLFKMLISLDAYDEALSHDDNMLVFSSNSAFFNRFFRYNGK